MMAYRRFANLAAAAIALAAAACTPVLHNGDIIAGRQVAPAGSATSSAAQATVVGSLNR